MGAGFADDCLKATRRFLESRGLQPSFSQVHGKKESYWKSVPMVLGGRSVELYVYDDEAGVMVGGNEWAVCERADFDSDSALIAALLQKLERIRSRP